MTYEFQHLTDKARKNFADERVRDRGQALEQELLQIDATISEIEESKESSIAAFEKELEHRREEHARQIDETIARHKTQREAVIAALEAL